MSKSKVHGHIPGYLPGCKFSTRMECSEAGVHAPPQAGIHGNAKDGAYSIVIAFGYADNQDNGETFIYTGEGGYDGKVSRIEKMRGIKRRGGKQVADQQWTKGNNALRISSKTKNPVRVVRGSNRWNSIGAGSMYAPASGYRYDGLYVVEEAWRSPGKSGFQTCRFRFARLPDQPPLGADIAQSASSNTQVRSAVHHRASATAGARNSFPSTNYRRSADSNPLADRTKQQATQEGLPKRSFPSNPHERSPSSELPPIDTLEVDSRSQSPPETLPPLRRGNKLQPNVSGSRFTDGSVLVSEHPAVPRKRMINVVDLTMEASDENPSEKENWDTMSESDGPDEMHFYPTSVPKQKYAGLTFRKRRKSE